MSCFNNHYNVLVAAVFASAAVTCGSVYAVGHASSRELDVCLEHFNRCQNDLLKLPSDSAQARSLREQMTQDMAKMQKLKEGLVDAKTERACTHKAHKDSVRKLTVLELDLKELLAGAINEMFVTRDDLVQFDMIRFDLLDQKLSKIAHDDARVSLIEQFMNWYKNGNIGS